jgi:hypothetical protein
MLKYAISKECELCEYVCTLASQGDDLEILMYAHKHGGSLCKDVCLAAAYNNNLEMLVYARANGCQWDERVL